jgi:CRISPR-associated protein Csx10
MAFLMNVQITFDSDWHIGEGFGQPKFIDHLARRDPHDRLPYVPAKTWLGIWRDACERVARGLDAGGGQGWQDLVNKIFGDQPARQKSSPSRLPPGPSRLTPSPARLPQVLRDLLTKQQNRALANTLTFIKPGVQIDRQTGTARQKHFHLDEVVRGGMTLQARAELDKDGLNADQEAAALGLLWAGAQTIERIGGKRRRGLGRCRVTIPELDQHATRHLSVLNAAPPTLPAKLQSPSARPATAVQVGTTGDLVRIPLRIELLQPVIVPDRIIGNVIYTRDHIPGTFLLGPISACIERSLGSSLGSLIARSDVRVTNAYREIDGERGRPTPFALFHAKDDSKGPHWNRLIEAEPSDRQLKQRRNGFVGCFNGRALPGFVDASETTIQATHSTIDDLSQRPTTDVGGVYTYQALAPNTVLRADLVLRKGLVDHLDAQHPSWRSALDHSARVGISKKDDYGLIKVGVANQSAASGAQPVQNGLLYLWLLSDALLRDSRNGHDGAIDTLIKALNARLSQAQLALSPRQPVQQGECVFARSSRNDGWLNRWGLPRPSYTGIAAGSCMVLQVTGTISAGEIATLASEGIGERRAEGYGELSINDPLLTTSLSVLLVATPGNAGAAIAGPVSDLLRDEPAMELARRLQREAWLRTVDRVAGSLFADPTKRRERLHWQTQKPGNSQLGSLRAPLMQVDRTQPGTKDLPALKDWLEEVRKGGRKDRWPPGALDVLDKLAGQPDLVWGWIRSAIVGREGNDHEPAEANELIQAELPLLPGDTRADIERAHWGMAVRRVLLAAIRTETRRRETPERMKGEPNDGAAVE